MADVIGHYAVHDTGLLRPLVGQSGALFAAVVTDNAKALEEALDASSDVNRLNLVLYWQAARPGQGLAAQTHDHAETNRVQCRARTLVHLAAYHGSLRCLALLLARGADPSLASPEGETAAQFALTGQSPQAATVRAMLEDAGGNFALPRSPGLDPVVPPPATQRTSNSGASAPGAAPRAHGMALDMLLPTATAAAAAVAQAEAPPFSKAAPYPTSELTRAEYSTDPFRMYCFKVLRCSKRYAHDWRSCPFAHPTENARRRDPREHSYCAAACPDYKQGLCLRGDTCQYSHGVFESWLHPSRYKTQLCKDGSACRRPVCFFAHALAELRTPTAGDGCGSADAGGTGGTAAADTLVPDDFAQDCDVRAAVQQQQAAMAASPAVPRALLESAAGLLDAPLPGDTDAGTAGGGGSGAADATSTATTMDQHAGLELAKRATPPPAAATPPLQHQQQQQQPSSRSAGSTSYQPGSTVPRMSNAFARFHGLNPKDGALHNLQMLQRMARVPASDGGAASAPVRQAAGARGGGGRSRGRRGDASSSHGGGGGSSAFGAGPAALTHGYSQLQRQATSPSLQQQQQPPLGFDPLAHGHLLAGQMMVPFAPLLPGAPLPSVPGMPPAGWMPPPQDAHSLALLFSAMGVGLPPGGIPLGPLPPPAVDLAPGGGLGLGLNAPGFPNPPDPYMSPPGPF